MVDRPVEVRAEFRKLGFEDRIGSHDGVGGEEGVGLFNRSAFHQDGAQTFVTKKRTTSPRADGCSLALLAVDQDDLPGAPHVAWNDNDLASSGSHPILPAFPPIWTVFPLFWYGGVGGGVAARRADRAVPVELT